MELDNNVVSVKHLSSVLSVQFQEGALFQEGGFMLQRVSFAARLVSAIVYYLTLSPSAGK